MVDIWTHEKNCIILSTTTISFVLRILDGNMLRLNSLYGILTLIFFSLSLLVILSNCYLYYYRFIRGKVSFRLNMKMSECIMYMVLLLAGHLFQIVVMIIYQDTSITNFNVQLLLLLICFRSIYAIGIIFIDYLFTEMNKKVVKVTDL